MLNIEIDGKPLQVEHGSTIIDAADKVGIAIPRFCYHKKLSVAANCRMCLVQVEKFNKPLPACATPVADGMKIFTRSKSAVEAQKSVMEFLLINQYGYDALYSMYALCTLLKRSGWHAGAWPCGPW